MISLLHLFILLFPVPALIGRLFQQTDTSAATLPFRWVSGQILLWSGFQLLCVPMILQENTFTQVQNLFNIYTYVLVAFAFLLVCRDRMCNKKSPASNLQAVPKPKSYYFMWALSAVLLLIQLILTVFLAYEEGDDAFYISHSTITVDSNTMYSKLPYTGGATGLDARHGLAPFPIWIAYLAKISNLPAVTVAQIVVPVVLICMAYALYYLIGKNLLHRHPLQLPFFLVLIEMLVIFGGYSLYSTENFLLVRTSQGKAVIANIILPFLMLLLLLLLNQIHNREKISFVYWLLLALTMVAGCLCSTLGSILTCMLLGITGLCTVICYRKWKLLLPLASCFVLPLCYALLYFLLDTP